MTPTNYVLIGAALSAGSILSISLAALLWHAAKDREAGDAFVGTGIVTMSAATLIVLAALIALLFVPGAPT